MLNRTHSSQWFSWSTKNSELASVMRNVSTSIEGLCELTYEKCNLSIKKYFSELKQTYLTLRNSHYATELKSLWFRNDLHGLICVTLLFKDLEIFELSEYHMGYRYCVSGKNTNSTV